ncbi:outer membrane beta-barrel protein [Permianibacter sp. IMCC34836]|uniref:outer membrane beta-barrel protein n=1 Tax=Permianibacter fluminis TaxID=2738515 RepID=UPI0015559A23|nr:outer membrane beta-barrel protein [Permianibacter fluminis]NQD35737.1 outer membrane beta-barrel protein [Permianibacter fluminis]
MKKFAVIALAMGLSPLVAAEQYVQVQIGQASTDSVADFCDYLDAVTSGTPGVSTKCDDKDTTYRISYGYMIDDMFAVEGGYQDLGTAEAKASAGPDSVRFMTDTKGYDVTGVARWKLNDEFTLVGRLGVMYWEQDFDYKSNSTSLYSDDDSGTSFLYGIGAEYMMLSFSYEIIDQVGDNKLEGFDIGDDVGRFSLGAKFTF